MPVSVYKRRYYHRYETSAKKCFIQRRGQRHFHRQLQRNVASPRVRVVTETKTTGSNLAESRSERYLDFREMFFRAKHRCILLQQLPHFYALPFESKSYPLFPVFRFFSLLFFCTRTRCTRFPRIVVNIEYFEAGQSY